MALEYTVNSLDGVDDGAKSLYKEIEGGGGYVLDVTGASSDADIAGLKKNRDDLLEEKRLATEASNNSKAEAERIASEKAANDARSKGDIDSLEKSYLEKVGVLEAQLADIGKRDQTTQINNEAMKLANALSEGYNVELMADVISKRLRYSEDGIKILDKAGALTVSTIADLESEFRADARYSSLVVVSKANGGGANGGNNGGNGGAVSTLSEATTKAQRLAVHANRLKSAGF